MLTATAAHLPQVPQEVPQAILERVERLLSTEDGVFDRSVGQVLAKEITDGLLIDIQGVLSTPPQTPRRPNSLAWRESG